MLARLDRRNPGKARRRQVCLKTDLEGFPEEELEPLTLILALKGDAGMDRA